MKPEKAGVENATFTLKDGRISCSFTIPTYATEVGVASLDTPYYVMLAYGPASGGVAKMHDGVVVSQVKMQVGEIKVEKKKKKKKRSNFVVYAHGKITIISTSNICHY